jgi:OmpA-OmpF porin, OOP family
MKIRLLMSGVLLVLVAACARDAVQTDWPGYRTDAQGHLLRDADGRCWRTLDWRPALAVAECDVSITGVPQADVPVQENVVQENAVTPMPPPLSVTFAFNEAVLTAQSEQALRDWYQRLPQEADQRFEVQGYTDPLGGHDFNVRLSERRARHVAGWLRQHGGSEVHWQGRGPDSSVTGDACQPLRGEERIRCHLPDRRVVVVVQRRQ